MQVSPELTEVAKNAKTFTFKSITSTFFKGSAPYIESGVHILENSGRQAGVLVAAVHYMNELRKARGIQSNADLGDSIEYLKPDMKHDGQGIFMYFMLSGQLSELHTRELAELLIHLDNAGIGSKWIDILWDSDEFLLSTVGEKE